MSDQRSVAGSEDITIPVQEKHQFDVGALQEYMKANVDGFSGNISVEQFSGGQSNPTYKLTTNEQSFVLRRKPPGKLLSSAHAVDREYRIITALADTEVPVATSRCLCEDESVIGTAFYIMDFLEGRVFWDSALKDIDKKQKAPFYNALVETMAALHKVDYKAVGLADYGRPENYVSRQVHRWSKQYKESGIAQIEAMDRLIEWLPQNIPPDKDVSIVHGDYRIDNVMFHKNEPRIIAVLDWELSTIGNPLADFAYHCMLWRLKPDIFHGMSGLDLDALGIPQEHDYVQHYCRITQREGIEDWDFYLAFNMFRLAAILHGILVRVHVGTAASQSAAEKGKLAYPLAESAWKQVEKIMARSPVV